MTNQTPSDTPASTGIANAHAGRRRMLQGLGLAGVALSGAMLPGQAGAATATRQAPSEGDIAVLQFLAAAELIEADLWIQYAELGGISTGPKTNYQRALERLDGDAGQYITSNTLDEQSHASFLNAYLAAIGAEPVNFNHFRTLPSSKATGAQQIGRLTNLFQLSVDTSWYVRYRSTTTPDFGATYPQALPQLAAGQFAAIPQNDAELATFSHAQALANTAAFHFGAIEQGGSSLYAAMAQRVSSAEVLEIVLGIGGDEVCHFLEWVDFAGNGVQPPVAPFTDPTTGLHFPNFIAADNVLIQPNLIFPVPCSFISPELPQCAVIRPISIKAMTAADAVAAFTSSGLFIGQTPGFLSLLSSLARAADRAHRG